MTLNVDKIMIWVSGKSRRRPLRSIRLLCTKLGDTPLKEVNRSQMRARCPVRDSSKLPALGPPGKHPALLTFPWVDS